MCVISVVCISCATTLNRRVEPRNETMIFAGDMATFYKNVDNNRVTPGERRKVKRHDSVRVISYSWDYVPFTTTYETHTEYLIVQGKDTLWVDTKDLISAYELQLQIEEQEFRANGGAVVLPKAQSDEAWGRAVEFVTKFSDMKIQVATDYIIDTYNPTAYKSGYTITRRTLGDEVKIGIVAKGTGRGGQAYKFIKYGR